MVSCGIMWYLVSYVSVVWQFSSLGAVEDFDFFLKDHTNKQRNIRSHYSFRMKSPSRTSAAVPQCPWAELRSARFASKPLTVGASVVTYCEPPC